MQKGTISVQTENIFPIIKQFLYSDQEIFLRELISNAVDATTKLKTLSSKGEPTGDITDTTIEIILDSDAGTLTIRDKGIGMTAEEVDKYLNQVAFSSAADFLEKYKGEAIIGHFGLGFYSAFMVSDIVTVVTKSYTQNSEGVTWICDGNPEYSIEKNEKNSRGTDIILKISEEAKEYLEKSRIESLLEKYCKFLPVPIKFGMKTEKVFANDDDETGTDVEVDNIVNNPSPLWKKLPSELTDEDYKNFYSELNPYSPPPLFWIHLNIDYPFNLTGVLYFPKLQNTMELQKNKIQLYSNQVYVTDEVKEIVPEFLTLLHGIIDSPDIPLNVSRSYLQSDKNVKKITGYISKKVAEKLNDIFKNNREDFEAKWTDIGTFVKYGMLSDESFHDRALKFALVRDTAGKCTPIEEYREQVKATQTDKHGKIVLLYTNDVDAHDAFIVAAKKRGYSVLVFDNMIDNHFIQHLEYKVSDITFVRVDSDTVDKLVQKEEKTESVLSEQEQAQVKALFEKVATSAGANVQLQALSPQDAPVTVTKPEFMRRMKEMQAMQGMSFGGDFPDSYNVVVNTNHPLVADKLLKMTDEIVQSDTAKYLTDLALLHQGMLKGANLTQFVEKSIQKI